MTNPAVINHRRIPHSRIGPVTFPKLRVMTGRLTPGRRSLLAASAAFLALLVLIAALSGLGGPHDARAGLISVLYILITAAPPALAYLVGAFGLGSLFIPYTKEAAAPHALQSALGLALMLSLSHALGVLGLLAGTTGFILGGAPVVLGIVLLARRIMKHVSARGEIAGRIPWQVLAGLPALALLLVAACSAPGWLWESEARGYDVLEYHLRLPQEWIGAGRIRPVDHNVYSYLPGYIESAFIHLAALMRAPVDAGPSHAMGLLTGEGNGVLSCQILVVGLALFAAAMVGRLTSALTRPWIGALSGTLFLSIPWVIVTGSMAYNEMGMLGLFAAGLLAALDVRISGTRRGLISGFLVGVACGCKPTALFLCAPVVGLALLTVSRAQAQPESQPQVPQTGTDVDGAQDRISTRVHPRHLRLLLPASFAGVFAILPWLIRNSIACGNPVFPMASGLFGPGHWSAEQVSRYIAGHAFSGSFAGRAAMLIDTGSQHDLPRGLLHPQWALFPIIILVGAFIALIRKSTRGPALLLTAGLITQLLAWMLFTHLQSRFLLPIAIPGCALFGLALESLWLSFSRAERASRPNPWPPAIKGAAAFVPIALAGMAIGIFQAQNDGHPNLTLLDSPWFRTGELDRAALKLATPDQQQDTIARMSPEAFLNVIVPPGNTVYLLGNAAPLYYSCPLVYNTTWDVWPIGAAIRKTPGNRAEWTRDLWSRGIRLILLDEPEIERLTRSGWIDPTVTLDTVRAWLKDEGRLVRSWRRVELWQLREPGK